MTEEEKWEEEFEEWWKTFTLGNLEPDNLITIIAKRTWLVSRRRGKEGE